MGPIPYPYSLIPFIGGDGVCSPEQTEELFIYVEANDSPSAQVPYKALATSAGSVTQQFQEI